jgi:hypothetical protein
MRVDGLLLLSLCLLDGLQVREGWRKDAAQCERLGY